MTKEEAIKRLREYSQYAYGIWHNDEEDAKAFDMAIDALSAQTDGDNISRSALIKQIEIDSDGSPGWYGDTWQFMKTIAKMPSTDRNGHWMSFEQVADMLSGMFGRCACDVNDNDDWLPLACKYADTECPHPKEENGCWMQFLMQGGADMRGEGDGR